MSKALEAHPGLRIAGATEVTSQSQALTDAGDTAALVVLGSRGYGRVVGALLGSVTFTVAARARCPVIVVKENAVDLPVGPEHRVVVGTDGSAEAAAAVGFAADRAAAASAAWKSSPVPADTKVEDVDERRVAGHGEADRRSGRRPTARNPPRADGDDARRGLPGRAHLGRRLFRRRLGGGRHAWSGCVRGDASRLGQSRRDPRRRMRSRRRRGGPGVTRGDGLPYTDTEAV